MAARGSALARLPDRRGHAHRGTYQAGCCSTSRPSKDRMRAPGCSCPWEPENRDPQLGNSSSSCGGEWGAPVPTGQPWAPGARAPAPAAPSQPLPVWGGGTACGPREGGTPQYPDVTRGQRTTERGHAGPGAGAANCGRGTVTSEGSPGNVSRPQGPRRPPSRGWVLRAMASQCPAQLGAPHAP